MTEPAEAKTATPALHQPYVPNEANLPEFTWPALLVGAALGIVFGASSLYLVLKVGMTVSASIPVAVLSITLFRLFTRVFGVRRATILENNIVQTAGSAGESIAFGIGVTMPAVILLGFKMEISQVMVAAVLGGAVGILMMIPLRRAFIVKQHGALKYPEGTACADVLIVGEQGGASARTVFAGFGVAFVYQFFWQGLRLWKETISRPLHWFGGAVPALEANPTLLGVGYIIGPRIACIMAGGGVLAAFVLVPTIRFFGSGLHDPLFPGTVPISAMSADDIAEYYVKYIGAGAVAAAGILSLVRAMPLIVGSLVAAIGDLRPGKDAKRGAVARTDRDIPLPLVALGALALIVAIWASLPLGSLWSPVNLLGAILIILFGFLFVTVSSRLTGEIGSSSNPISGMTVATLLLTCLIFLALGWKSPPYRLIALSVAAIVCVASSNGGTTSQDLKTGYLVGATPKYQQLAILVGSISSALVIGSILMVLIRASTVYTTQKLPQLAQPLAVADLPERAKAPNDNTNYHVWRAAEGNPQGAKPGTYLVDNAGRIRKQEVLKNVPPQARIFALITDGILNQKLPWTLVLLGVAITAVLELSGVSSLAFAVGVYLPLSSSAPIFVGGVVRWAADRWTQAAGGKARSEAESEMSSGVLMATGFIAGGAMAGVLIAFLLLSSERIKEKLGVWQYRLEPVAAARPLAEECADAAARELGLGQARSAVENEEFKSLSDEIADLNVDQLARFVAVPAGAKLALPNGQTLTTPHAASLGRIAAESLGSEDQAELIFDLNEERLAKPDRLPAGAELKIPQRNWPSLAAFAGLAAALLFVALRRTD